MNKYVIDDSDENFLLDDDGAREKTHSSHGEIIWTRKPNKNNKWGNTDNISVFNEASGAVIATILEDHSDNLEDSPLLINVSTLNYYK